MITINSINERNACFADPYAQIENAYRIVNGFDCNDINVDLLQDGAREFERFWLRPQSKAGRIVPLRIKINKKFGGWRLKDELIKALGLSIGDCINTEVSVLFGRGLIDDDGETDLFAEGNAADWLLDVVDKADGPEGCVFDCFVMFSYCQAPVGGLMERVVYKASLILLRGIRFVTHQDDTAEF